MADGNSIICKQSGKDEQLFSQGFFSVEGDVLKQAASSLAPLFHDIQHEPKRGAVYTGERANGNAAMLRFFQAPDIMPQGLQKVSSTTLFGYEFPRASLFPQSFHECPPVPIHPPLGLGVASCTRAVSVSHR